MTTAAGRHRSGVHLFQILEYTSSTSRGVHDLFGRSWRHPPPTACQFVCLPFLRGLACANSSTPSTCPNPIRAGTRKACPERCPVAPTCRGICVGCVRHDLRRDGWCVLATRMMSSRSVRSPPLPLPSPPIRALGRGRDRRRADGAGLLMTHTASYAPGMSGEAAGGP
jgi:hypothetical protein